MKRLILVRHAKSSWSNDGMADRDRPLNPRGRLAAERVGGWLSATGRQPDKVLSSPAVRCRQTWEGIAKGGIVTPDVEFIEALYLADAPEILDALHTATGDTVLLLGHMPGIGDLAHGLRQDPPPHHDAFGKYPTGSATVLDFPIDDWSALQMGTGVLDIYATPNDM